MPLYHFECLNEPSQFAHIIQSNSKTQYSQCVLNQIRKDELSFWALPGGCFQHFTGWIAVQGVGSFFSNTGRGALECSMQRPISDFLPHNAPVVFIWGHKRVYATANDNIITQQDPIVANLALVCRLFLGRKHQKQHHSWMVFSKCNNALVLFSVVSQCLSWGYCWRVTLAEF